MSIDSNSSNGSTNEQSKAAQYLYESAQKLASASTGTRNIEMWGMFAWSVLAVAETSDDQKQVARIQLATIAARAINEVLPINSVEVLAEDCNVKQLLALSRIALARTELAHTDLSNDSKLSPYLNLLDKFNSGEVQFILGRETKG